MVAGDIMYTSFQTDTSPAQTEQLGFLSSEDRKSEHV